MESEFSKQIFVKKKAQMSNFSKIRPVEAELFHTEGATERQTDMTKIRVSFRSTENAPKKYN
jgi:hypothetical protein